jgi:D-proline reductase (dithiol) PrdB
VSVLARLIEAAGIPTVVVTMMPAVSTAIGVPRIVGVEFPYGHPFGMPHAVEMQRRVLTTALTVLAGASSFGTRVDIDIAWPQDAREAYRSWQPSVPSPLIAQMLAQRAQAPARDNATGA